VFYATAPFIVESLTELEQQILELNLQDKDLVSIVEVLGITGNKAKESKCIIKRRWYNYVDSGPANVNLPLQATCKLSIYS
jgi:hypothetical protein